MSNYNKWVKAYDTYLNHMYYNILLKYRLSENISKKDFCDFMYFHSSGYITPYI
jgi:hypothetical protein